MVSDTSSAFRRTWACDKFEASRSLVKVYPPSGVDTSTANTSEPLPSFYLNLPLGGLAAAVIIFTFRTPEAQCRHPGQTSSAKEKFLQMDLPGLILIIGAIQCLLLALYWGGVSEPWNSNNVIGTLVGFGLLTIVFIAVEFQQKQHAMLVHRLLKKREVWVGSAFSFLYVSDPLLFEPEELVC